MTTGKTRDEGRKTNANLVVAIGVLVIGAGVILWLILNGGQGSSTAGETDEGPALPVSG